MFHSPAAFACSLSSSTIGTGCQRSPLLSCSWYTASLG